MSNGRWWAGEGQRWSFKTSAVVAAMLATALGGCYRGNDGDSEPGGFGEDAGEGQGAYQGPGECIESREFFNEQVWLPVMQKTCLACHNPKGAAKDTDLVLQTSDYPGYLEANFNTVRNVAQLEVDGVSLILAKPSELIDHGGKLQLVPDSEEYKAFAELVRRFDAPITCVNPDDIAAFYEPVELLDETETLRKAALLLANRLPTDEELDAVRGKGIDSLDAVLDEMLTEQAFFERVKIIYNDMFLTDAYLEGTAALELLDEVDFPNRLAGGAAANTMIAREPLEIIEWVVKNDRPFSEVITADYTIINGASAMSYGIDPTSFVDPTDPSEKIEWRFEGVPAAGVLSTVSWLNRFPTTETNRNRARARYVYDFFLATDLLKLAARPIDSTTIGGHNPTLYDPNCTSCHQNMDPVAGAFQNWDANGRYRPPEGGWYGDMRPPGLGDDMIPGEEQVRALPWLTGEIVKDAQFSMAVVHTVHEGLTGQAPLADPDDPNDPAYLARIRAFEAQDYTFKQIVAKFQNSNFDFKLAVKEVVKGPWFRAYNAEPLDEQRAEELSSIGTGRLLTPELLDSKIRAAVGVPWVKDGADALLSEDVYKFFYGGIDSFAVTRRLDQMNGIMVNIAERMSSEVACIAAPNDFGKPQAQRILFPFVEMTDTPENGGETAIRNNLQHLMQRVLGKNYELDHNEIERAYQVFQGVWDEGRFQGLGDQLPVPCRVTTDPLTGEVLSNPVASDPDYVVRAWIGVMTYLLSDYDFLHE